jgi:hypothetical protein
MGFKKKNNKFNRTADEPKIMRAPLPKDGE